MDLQPASSFVPTQSSGRHRKKLNKQDQHPFGLIPSQVLVNTASSDSDSHVSSPAPPLIPSQVLKHHKIQQARPGKRAPTRNGRPHSNATITSFITEDLSKSRRRRRKPARRKHMEKDTGENKTGKKRRQRVLSGDLPDIHWRAFPMEHLRLHPLFVPLPPPDTISSLDSLEDVRLFRQDSWQWDALHEGRITTSQAAAALGFLEPQAAQCLNIPTSWRRGGKSAYYRLREKPLRTLVEMNAVLCDRMPSVRSLLDDPWSVEPDDDPLWIVPPPNKDGRPFPFAAKYCAKITREERNQRRQKAQAYAANGCMSVRMSWGSAQEATSLLTALNYFWKLEPGVRLKEAGMCGAGLSFNQTTSSLLVGASPDGILCYPNGTVEALEVKNHCPFVPASSSSGARYAVRQLPFQEKPTVFPLYIPQLMMEMLCIGPECRSAVMVRQTGTNGAVILRLHRDDEWIDEMMFWLDKFQNDFVDNYVPPHQDFFMNDAEFGDRYTKFLQWTKELSDKVELLHHVKHKEVQRVLSTSRNITSLFLD